jgi:nucleoid DNA-binding protein
MRLETHIEELLYRYNCVVIPEFGAFLTQVKSAFIESSSHTFYPPSKVLSFNEQLTSNDGLLVSHIAAMENNSYEKVQHTLETVVKEWKKKLKEGDRLVINNVGSLKLNSEHKIVFQPSRQINYLTSSFGLSSFIATPVIREQLKKEVAALEEKVPFIVSTEEREQNAFRPLLKYAAIALLAIATGLTGYRAYNENLSRQLLTQEKAQEIISNSIQQATFFDAKPIELPPLQLEVTRKKINIRHHVIAGAFREKNNAERKVRRLRNKGYDAFVVGQNKFGLYQVAFDSFENPTLALAFLKNVRQTESRDAWLLTVK